MIETTSVYCSAIIGSLLPPPPRLFARRRPYRYLSYVCVCATRPSQIDAAGGIGKMNWITASASVECITRLAAARRPLHSRPLWNVLSSSVSYDTRTAQVRAAIDRQLGRLFIYAHTAPRTRRAAVGATLCHLCDRTLPSRRS